LISSSVLEVFTVELPAGQGGASGLGSWGVDSGAGSTQTANALVVDFVTTPGDDGVGHFGVDLLDFESSAEFGAAQLRVYDDGQLVYQQPLLWDSDNGNNVSHFVGIVAGSTDAMFDQVALVVGDDDGNGVGSERWAADRLTFGRATNPEPTSGMLALGVTALVAGARRFRRRSAGSTDS
jgi:hypothetical protein